MIRELFAYLPPVMLVALAMLGLARQVGLLRRRGAAWAALALSAPIALVPVRGLSLAGLILSANPFFSAGSAALLSMLLYKSLLGRELLTGKRLLWFSAWNVSVSAVLFLSCLGFVPWDVYALGYEPSLWVWPMAFITLLLVLGGNPLASVFIFHMLVFDLGLVPTGNFFDSLTDGFLFLASCVVLAHQVRARSARTS